MVHPRDINEMSCRCPETSAVHRKLARAYRVVVPGSTRHRLAPSSCGGCKKHTVPLGQKHKRGIHGSTLFPARRVRRKAGPCWGPVGLQAHSNVGELARHQGDAVLRSLDVQHAKCGSHLGACQSPVGLWPHVHVVAPLECFWSGIGQHDVFWGARTERVQELARLSLFIGEKTFMSKENHVPACMRFKFSFTCTVGGGAMCSGLCFCDSGERTAVACGHAAGHALGTGECRVCTRQCATS